MTTNVRLHYPSQAAYIKEDGASGAYTYIHGMQSGSDNADIPTENINTWGQSSPYEIIEDTPEVSIDFERVLDGCAPIYLLASQGAASATISGREGVKSVVAIGMYNSANSYANGSTLRTVEFSGVQISSVGYTFNVDGAFTENVSFVGNERSFAEGGSELYGSIPSDPTSGGADEPCALTGCSGGVQLKENLKYNGTYPTLLPTVIPGVSSSGTVAIAADNIPTVPVQSISISADFGRETISILGARGAYARTATFPIEVTCDIEILSQSGDGINITELGVFDGCDYANAPYQRIRVATDGGLIIDLGNRNKLTSIAQTHGDTGGGNATYTLSFVGQSVMSVFHQQDPSAIVYSGFWQ